MNESFNLVSVRTLQQSILHLGNQVLWCEVISRGRADFEVHVVPQSSMSTAVVERFRTMAGAIRRHAELSWLLREAGWEPVPTRYVRAESAIIAGVL